ncbi:hypothetical protein [Gilvibacter sediminis]|uniref:hypothetical protein n=1 Tax=Gilvibacter sediminis TaxID=379071 RepID=UPI002350410B|nr:hypothetical protein [Gilvibacter sediminis]MDC7997807.1 hypothetical protein [Gilvibacter sediminis]
MRKIVMMVLVAGSILSSCTQEEQNETLETTNFTALVNKATDLQATGVYKGTFSSYTNDSRGIVMIQLNNAGKAKATLRFADGSERVIIADTEAANEKGLQGVRFINEAVSFEFTVEQDGAKPLAEGFQLGTTDASMKVLKETTRGPLLPISGTYTCDNCDIHPLLESGVAQTFNATTVSGGGNNDQDIVTQIMLSGRDYGTAVGNAQSGCSNS